jgi:integrase
MWPKVTQMAATDLLSDKAIQAAIKAAVAEVKPKKISDGGGLLLIARPTGTGWWRMRYWIDSKEGMMSLGTYPEISLKDARKRREEIKRQVANGENPGDVRKSDKAVRKAKQEVATLVAQGKPLPGTFEAVARDWLVNVHQAKVTAGHSDRTGIRFEQDVYPWLGRRDIASIEAPELLEVLMKVIGRGAIETAHRIKDASGQVFRYGIAKGLCKRNPAADLRDALPPVPTRHFAAIVEPKHATGLLQAMMDYKGNPVTRAALQLSALLFLRPGELRQLEWAWLDRDESVLQVPSTLMKRSKDQKQSGKPHIVPLAPQALNVLNDLQPLTGVGRYIFPSLLSKERPMSENTVRTALRRMGYSNDDMTPHGFRAMARTMAAERLGIASEVIEAQLAHAVPDALGRAYNRTEFLAQRRDLMLKWADYLDKLRIGNVIKLADVRAA